MHAAYNGHADAVSRLIEAGAKLEATDKVIRVGWGVAGVGGRPARTITTRVVLTRHDDVPLGDSPPPLSRCVHGPLFGN